MGGFVLLPPVALFTSATAAASAAATGAAGASAVAVTAGGRVAAAGSAPDPTEEAVVAATVGQMYATHNSPDLARHAAVYARLLHRLLHGADLRAAVADAGAAIGVDIPSLVASTPRPADDTRVIGGRFTSACYIEGSFPSLLYLAFKYAADPNAALLANTNAGGENAHRGSALGAVMGVAHGVAGWREGLVTGLADGPAIAAEVDALVAAVERVVVGEGEGAGK
jgi:ADP-ribosyl-[dinitrogen reductase] hydrolase